MRKIRFIHFLFLVLMGAGLQMSGKAHASDMDQTVPTGHVRIHCSLETINFYVQ